MSWFATPARDAHGRGEFRVLQITKTIGCERGRIVLFTVETVTVVRGAVMWWGIRRNASGCTVYNPRQNLLFLLAHQLNNTG